MPRLDLGSQSAVSANPHGGVARLVNVFARNGADEGKVKWPLDAVSGLGTFVTLAGAGGVRRMLEVDGVLYVVAGRVVHRVDASGGQTVLGGFPSDGFVTMARNARASGAQIGIVGNGLFGLVAGGTLTMSLDPDLRPPNSICYLGGYFFFTHADGRFSWSELEAGDDIDGLSFAMATANPDGLLVGKPRGRDLVLFGPRSMEIRALNDGGGDAPVSFRSALNVGCFAPGSVVEAADTLFWLSTTDQGAFGGVRVLNGDTTAEIGSDYVNRSVARETSPEAITGTVWTEDGRTHIAWSGTGWTHVYDLTTQRWHERESLGMSRWRVAHTVQLGGEIMAGDAAKQIVYKLGAAYYDEAGTELVTTVQTPPLIAFPSRVEVDSLFIDAIPGVGLVTGAPQDVDPHVAMQWTSDGRTWSTELRRSLGRGGATGTRVIWRRLGTQAPAGRTYRFRSSARVMRTYYDCRWNENEEVIRG